jgi:hypothetical protein
MAHGIPAQANPGRGCKGVRVIVAATCCSMHVMRKLPVVPICRMSAALRCRANQNDARACLAPIRGAARDRHGRWERDAMDAHRRAQLLRDERRFVRTAKSCGPGAPMQALSLSGDISRGDGGNQAWSPGRSRISRKAIAQGRPDDPPVPVVLPRASCCTRAMGAVGTRPSLRPCVEKICQNVQTGGWIRTARCWN